MIETPRLIIRRWRSDDDEALYALASDARVSDPAGWPRHDSIEMSRRVLESIFIPAVELYAVELKATGRLVGCVGLVPSGEEFYRPAPGEREVGYWIGFPYWGRGYASEALRGIIGHCASDLRLPSLLLTARTDNRASQRVAAKAGFTRIGSFCAPDGTANLAFRLVLS